MSELQLYYDNFSARVSTEFSDHDPKLCGCHGRGWFLSEVDTWHECPRHPGRRHPDDYEGQVYDNDLLGLLLDLVVPEVRVAPVVTVADDDDGICF